MSIQPTGDSADRQAAGRRRARELGPEVSVIIPTYNRRAALTEAVASVLNQSFRCYELIVVDDGSSDDTAAYLRVLSGFPSVRCLRIPHCGMPGAVRNRGAAAAAGRYLAFLDSDDLWRHDKLARQTALMRASGCALSHTRELWVRGGAVVSQRKQRHRRAGYVFPEALRKCIIGPSTAMMSTVLFRHSGGFREDLEIAEDYELWLRLTAQVEVAYLNEPLTVKRGGASDQLSAKYSQIEGFRIAALEQLLEQGAFDESAGVAGRATPAARRSGAAAAGYRPPVAAAALAEYRRKCRIYAEGCRKRGRAEEAAALEARAAALLARFPGSPSAADLKSGDVDDRA